jgi:hypothetical protein
MVAAVPISVPLRTDPVAPSRLATGRLTVAGGSESRRDIAETALFFEVAEQQSLGRVTFEGLDSLRLSRGEVAPYDDGNDFSSWVYQVVDSEWLRERHAYEVRHYQTPMLDTHKHYVFRLHDEFAEALARGIWLDQPSEQDPFKIGPHHPFATFDLAQSSEGAAQAASTGSFGAPRKTQPLCCAMPSSALSVCSSSTCS